MPQVTVGIERDRGEEDDDRLVQRVRRLDRSIEGRIVDRALRPLHPVDDASTVRIGIAFPPHPYARVVLDPFNSHDMTLTFL